MKSFFANMNLARMIIILSIFASGYLAYASWTRYQEVHYLNGTFLREVPNICKEIQEHSLLNTELSKDIKGDLYIKEASLESYVRKCAETRSAEIGEVTVNASNRQQAGGVIDNQIMMNPIDRKKEFSHSQIAAFLYRLEADSNQIKVTDLSFQLAAKGIKPDDVPGDKWTFDATITNRVKDPTKTAGANQVPKKP